MSDRTLFIDLDQDYRMELRTFICDHGGDVSDYQGEAVQVLVPNPPWPFYDAMKARGFTREGRCTYFPLGSDHPAESMRHDGSYPGSRGFWLYANFIPPPQDFKPPVTYDIPLHRSRVEVTINGRRFLGAEFVYLVTRQEGESLEEHAQRLARAIGVEIVTMIQK